MVAGSTAPAAPAAPAAPVRRSEDELIGRTDFVAVDHDKCTKCGICCMTAPDTFVAAFGPGNKITRVVVEKAGFKSAARSAASRCPSDAIVLAF